MEQLEQEISGLMEVDTELVKRKAARKMALLWGLSLQQNKQKRRKKGGKIIGGILLSIACLLGLAVLLVRGKMPETICLFQGETSQFSFHLPVTGEVQMVQNSGQSDIPADKISIHFNQDVVMRGDALENDVNVHLKLFGFLPIGSVDVKTISKKKVIPVGVPIGVYLKDTGVLIVGTGSFTDAQGMEADPCKNLLYSGEYIMAVNGKSVSKKNEIVEYVSKSRGQTITFTVRNGAGERQVEVTPKPDQSGYYKLGVWLRDNAQGIGTMTYLEENGEFAAFGHGLSDTDTKELVEMTGGSAYETEIVKIKKGEKGIPGEMTGRITYDENNRFATVSYNLGSGIYGTVKKGSAFTKSIEENQAVEIGLKQEVVPGKAYLMNSLDGETKLYEVEITKVSLQDKKQGRGITFIVKDKELLEQTGGIVQGMSGSPILQNGKLVGAVTHVFVEDPTKGYAIFIENMINEKRACR